MSKLHLPFMFGVESFLGYGPFYHYIASVYWSSRALNPTFSWSSGIHRLKQSMPKRKAGKMAKSYDPIAPVAEEISEEACLLCFDEFQVNMFLMFPQYH